MFRRTALALSTLVAAVLLSAGSTSAHLDSLLNPRGGFPYEGGKSMIVKWTIGNNHNGIDVHLSTDDKTWTTLVADLGKTQTAWSWSVPANLRTDRARIRICQKSGPQGCTDADSLSDPSDGPLYTLVSGRFRIESASTRLVSPRIAGGAPGAGPSLNLGEGFRILLSVPGSGSRRVLDLRGRELPPSAAR